MRKIVKKTYRFVANSVKIFDRYPKLISFTFKGESEFKTFIGGFISIGTFVILMLYAYLMFRVMIERSDTTKNVTSAVTDLTNDSNTITLKGTSFMFGFTISSSIIDLSKDETYIGLSAKMYTQSGNVTTSKTISFSKCTTSDFPTISSSLISKMGLTDYFCPSLDDLSLLGNKFSDRRNFFEMTFTRCSGTDSKGNVCKSTPEIDNALNNAGLGIAMVNTYYDFDDYNSPIKNYLDDQFFYYFTSGYYKESYVYIQQNTVEQKDSFFRYSPDGSQTNFLAIENVKDNFETESSTSKEVMSIKFYKDSISKIYERQVFSLLEFFGNVGGANDILELTGAFIVGLFSGKVFLFSVISSLYQVDSVNIDKRKRVIQPVNLESNLERRFDQSSNELKAESFVRNSHNNVHDIYEENKFEVDDSFCSNDKNKNSTHHARLSNDVIAKAANSMKKRYRYSYSFFDFIYNFLIPAKTLCCCRSSIKHLNTRYRLFMKGQNKFVKEFDSIEFARSQRKLKMFVHWLMNKSERFLAVYQKSNAISLTSESKSESDNPLYANIPKMLDNNEKKENHQAIVNRFLHEYLKETHTHKDQNLMYGVYSNKLYKADGNVLKLLTQKNNFDESKEDNNEKHSSKHPEIFEYKREKQDNDDSHPFNENKASKIRIEDKPNRSEQMIKANSASARNSWKNDKQQKNYYPP